MTGPQGPPYALVCDKSKGIQGHGRPGEERLDPDPHRSGDQHRERHRRLPKPGRCLVAAQAGDVSGLSGGRVGAAAILRDARTFAIAKLGPDHPERITATENMALARYSHGMLAEAEPLYREAIDGWRRTVGEVLRRRLPLYEAAAHVTICTDPLTPTQVAGDALRLILEQHG